MLSSGLPRRVSHSIRYTRILYRQTRLAATVHGSKSHVKSNSSAHSPPVKLTRSTSHQHDALVAIDAATADARRIYTQFISILEEQFSSQDTLDSAPPLTAKQVNSIHQKLMDCSHCQALVEQTKQAIASNQFAKLAELCWNYDGVLPYAVLINVIRAFELTMKSLFPVLCNEPCAEAHKYLPFEIFESPQSPKESGFFVDEKLELTFSKATSVDKLLLLLLLSRILARHTRMIAVTESATQPTTLNSDLDFAISTLQQWLYDPKSFDEALNRSAINDVVESSESQTIDTSNANSSQSSTDADSVIGSLISSLGDATSSSTEHSSKQPQTSIQPMQSGQSSSSLAVSTNEPTVVSISRLVSARRHDRVGFLSNLGHALSSTHGGQHSLLVASSHSVMNPLLRLLSLQFCSALSFRTLASAMRIGLMIKPSHFASVVDFLLRTGDFQKATRLIHEACFMNVKFEKDTHEIHSMLSFFAMHSLKAIEFASKTSNDPRLTSAMQTLAPVVIHFDISSLSCFWLSCALQLQLSPQSVSQFVRSVHVSNHQCRASVALFWFGRSMRLIPHLRSVEPDVEFNPNVSADHELKQHTDLSSLGIDLSDLKVKSEPQSSQRPVKTAVPTKQPKPTLNAVPDDVDGIAESAPDIDEPVVNSAPAASNYTIEMLQTCIKTLSDLKIHVPHSKIAELASSLMLSGMPIPALHLYHTLLQQSKIVDTTTEAKLACDAAPMPTNLRVAIPSTFVEGDLSPMQQLQDFVRHTGTAIGQSGNDSLMAAVLQLGEASSLRLASTNESHSNAYKLLCLGNEPPSFDQCTSKRSNDTLMGYWSTRVRAATFTTVQLLQPIQQLINVHHDRATLRAALDRLYNAEKPHDKFKHIQYFRFVLMRSIVSRNMFQLLLPHLRVEPTPSRSPLSWVPHNATTLPKPEFQALIETEMPFISALIAAYRINGQHSLALSAFGGYLSQLLRHLQSARLGNHRVAKSCIPALESLCTSLTLGEWSNVQPVPPELATFLVQWMRALEGFDDGHVKLTGQTSKSNTASSSKKSSAVLDSLVCSEVLSITQALGKQMRSDPLFGYLISHLRTQLQSSLLLSSRHGSSTVHQPLLQLFLDQCRHTRTIARRWFAPGYFAQDSDDKAFAAGTSFTALSRSRNMTIEMHKHMPGAFIAIPFLQILWPQALARFAPPDQHWHSESQYLSSLRTLNAFSHISRHVDAPARDHKSQSFNVGQPGSSLVSYSLLPELGLIFPNQKSRPSTKSKIDRNDSNSNAVAPSLPPPIPQSLVKFANGPIDLSLEACAIIDMHYLRSPEAVLYQLTVHLSALQRRVADLCLQHPELARKLQTSALKSASATSSAVTVLNDTLSLDATRALGFRSLTIVVGRGRNAATQGYAILRTSLFEALAALDLAPIAHSNCSMLHQGIAGALRPPEAAVEAVTFYSQDLWRWCVSRSAHGGLVRLETSAQAASRVL